MNELTPEAVTFGDPRFLHDAELKALTWVEGRLLGLTHEALVLWSAEGQRLCTLPMGAVLDRWGDLAFYPSSVPGRVVIGRRGYGDTDFITLSVSPERIEILARLPHGVGSDVSYYIDAVDLGEHLLVACGGWLERRTWADGAVERLVESPFPEGSERGVALSPGGRLVAFSDYPHPAVAVLDPETGHTLARIHPTKVHGGFGPQLCFSSDGQRLYTAYSQMYRTAVEEWDLGGERLRELVAHVGTGEVMSLQQHGDRLLLRQAGVDVLCWELSGGQLLWNQRNQALPAQLAYEAEAGLFIAAERRALALDPASGAALGEAAGLSGLAHSLSYDPVTRRVIACGGKSAVVFDADGAVVDRVDAVSLDPVPGGGEVILRGRGRSHAQVDLVRYSLADGARRPLLSGGLGALQHGGEAILILDSYFSQGSKRARVYSTAGKELLALGRLLPDQGAISPDGQRVVLTKGTRLMGFDAGTGEALWDKKKATKGKVEQLAFSPNGQRYAAASARSVSVWEGDRLAYEFSLGGAPRALQWLDDARVVVITENGYLSWRGADGGWRRRQLPQPIHAAHLAEDGTLLVSSEPRGLERYDVAELLGITWTPPAPEPEAGPFLEPSALQGADGAAVLAALEGADWAGLQPDRDLPPLRELLSALEAREGVTAAHRLAAARLLERDDAELLHRFGHEEATTAFGLSPDGRWLASGSWVGSDYERGGTLQLWDVRAGRCVNILDPVDGGVGWPDYEACLQWSPDGSRLGVAYNTNCVGALLPFEQGVVFESDSCVTNGWSRPPAFCWGPDSRRLVVFAWGPSPLPGCVIPAGQGMSYEDDVTWFAPALPEGVEVELQPQKGGTWSPDGARIQGHDTHGHAYAIDPESRQLLWLIDAATPAAWSPDGASFAHSQGGLRLHEARDGALRQALALGGVKALTWSPDSRTLAATLGDGVQLIREDKLAAHLAGQPAKPRWDFPDGHAWAFSPDSRHGALLEQGGRVRVWSLSEAPALLAEAQLDEAVGGILLGDGVLIGVGKGVIEFRELQGMGLIARYTPGEPRGDLLEAPKPLVKGRVDASARFALDPSFPMRGEGGHQWVLAFPGGLVVAPVALQPRLDEELSLVVGRRHALPFRWLDVPVFEDLAAAAGHPALPLSEAELKALLPKKRAPAPARKPRGPKPLDLTPGPLTLLTEAWWQAVKGLHSGWDSHVSEYLTDQVRRLLLLGHVEAATKAAPRVPEAWWRAVAFAQGARILAERGDAAAAEGWLSQGLALEAKARTPWNSTRLCGALAVACHALGRDAEAERLLVDAAEHVADEANGFQRYSALADAQRRCGREAEAWATLEAGPWQAGWVPHMLRPYVVERLREDLDAGTRMVDLIIEKVGKCDEFDISDAAVAALIAAGRGAEVPEYVKRFEGLSTHHYVLQAIEALLAAGEHAQARAALDQAIADVAKWPASQVRWAPLLLRIDRAAGEAFTLELLGKGVELAKSYYPGEALGHLAHALVLMGQVAPVMRFAEQLPKPATQLQVLLGGLRGAPDDATLREAALARVSSGGARERARDLAALAAATGDATLWDQALEVAKETTRDDRRWVTDDLVGAAVKAEDWQVAWRALQVVPKSKRQYNMMGLVDALAARGLARAVLTLAEQQDTKDLNDRPNTLSRAIERFPLSP
ncbi:MAG: hypothetical protein H6741_16120 [Alphaproteobacteria bacterium]|nr:hypothetical protein [Alphaproteobacteria bacterium]MCB9794240.1 hypothetical protein [Alphaproteobacteria bacterium]